MPTRGALTKEEEDNLRQANEDVIPSSTVHLRLTHCAPVQSQDDLEAKIRLLKEVFH